jgi:hypothetical protein
MKTYTQLLNEIGLHTAARTLGARTQRTMATPSEHGVKQMARNLDHVVKKARKAGIVGGDVVNHPVVQQGIDAGMSHELKQTPKLKQQQMTLKGIQKIKDRVNKQRPKT